MCTDLRVPRELRWLFIAFLLCAHLSFAAAIGSVPPGDSRLNSNETAYVRKFSEAATNLELDTVNQQHRRAAGPECRDTKGPIKYSTKKGKVVETLCKKVGTSRCKRSLVDQFKMTVKDVCPVACGSCGGSSFDYEHVVGRVDSKDSCGKSSIVLAVTNREIYVGCHSFEEYLSPEYRTVFILNKDFAKLWKIEDLVRGVDCRQSLGATLLLLDNHGGELLGRRIAADYIKREFPQGNVDFLAQMNCDVHSVPKNHAWYKPLEESVLQMTDDFLIARAQQEPRKHRGIEYPDFPLVNNRRPILAMSPLLFEEFPERNELIENLHGMDSCDWVKNGGRSARPNRRLGGYPWLCSPHTWENHMVIFDVEKLEEVRHEYLDIPRDADVNSFPSDTRFTTRFAERHDMTIVVNQDVYFHQNFAHARTAFDEYDITDLDEMRVMSWTALGELRGPSVAYDLFGAWNSIGMEPYLGMAAMTFARRHAWSSGLWLPDLDGEPVDDSLSSKMIAAWMSIFGYEVLDESSDFTTYGLSGVFPANIYVELHTGESYKVCNDCLEFLQIKVGRKKVYRYVAKGHVESRDMRSMKPELRQIRVPKKGSIEAMFGPSAIEGSRRSTYIHQRGIYKRGNSSPCGAPDQNKKKACGYLESSSFDDPY